MIPQLFLIPIFALVKGLLGLLPDTPFVNLTLTNLISFIRKGLYFTDVTIFATVMTIIITFSGIQMSWVIIEWIYKKIPMIK